MSKTCAQPRPSNLPQSSLSLRTRKFFRIWRVPPDPANLKGEEPVSKVEVQGEVVNAQWSSNGSVFAVTFQDQALVLYTLSDSEVAEDTQLHSFPLPLPESLQNLPAKQLKWVAFSPRGTYLSTFWVPGGLGFTELSEPNYYVWRVNRLEGKITDVTAVFCEKYKTLASPGPMQWRDDEQIRVFTKNGQLHIHAGHDFEKSALATLPLAAKFSVSIAPKCLSEPDALCLTLFSPASTNGETPGELRLFLSTIQRSEADEVTGIIPNKIALKEFASVDGCDFLWSPSGRICMMMTSTLVDAAGDNYGSVGDLWLCDLAATRRRELEGKESNSSDVDMRLASMKASFGLPAVPVAYLQVLKINERVTQDAKWSPTADEFILIEGKAPSDIYLYDGATGERVHTFAKGYKNQIVWNSQGDMVAIGGFGNLAGDLSFYHRDVDRQITLINEWRESCTVLCDWSPCGNYFFTASVRPRMNVDNQIKLWNREGLQLLHVSFDELNGVEWKHETNIEYPLPPTPRPSERMQKLNAYRPRYWASTSQENQLITRFYNGEISENDLPEDIRKRILHRGRNNGIRPFDKARFGTTDKACDTAMDWRSSEPVSEEKKELSESETATTMTSSAVANKSKRLSLASLASPVIAEDNAVPNNSSNATKKDSVSKKAKKEQTRQPAATVQPVVSGGGVNSSALSKRTKQSVNVGDAPPSAPDPDVSSSGEGRKFTSGKNQPIISNSATRGSQSSQQETRGDTRAPSVPKKPLNVKNDSLAGSQQRSQIPQAAVTMPATVQPPQKPTIKLGGDSNQSAAGSHKQSVPPQLSQRLAGNAEAGASYLRQQSQQEQQQQQGFPIFPLTGDAEGGVNVGWSGQTSGTTPSVNDPPVRPTIGGGQLFQQEYVPPSAMSGVRDRYPAYEMPVARQPGMETPVYGGSLVDKISSQSAASKVSPFPGATSSSSTSQSTALSDTNILSLLQSILPSHAKLHVRSNPIEERNADSSFLRYFNQPRAGVSSQPSLPQVAPYKTNGSPAPASGYSMNSGASGAPPAFPMPRSKEEPSDREREQEQARFLALIEQAGLKLPSLASAPRSAQATQAGFRDAGPQSLFTRPRPRQQWQPQQGQPIKAKAPSSVGERSWPSLQEVFSGSQDFASQAWNSAAQIKQRSSYGALSGDRCGDASAQRPNASMGDPTAAGIDASLRDLLKDLQMKPADSIRPPEYAVKEILQPGNRAYNMSQNVEAARKRPQPQPQGPNWQQDPAVLSRRAAQNEKPPKGYEMPTSAPQGSSSGTRRIWQYVDPKGNVQGPFSRKEMRAWWEKGYFAGDLPVRCNVSEEFVTLQEMFPDAQRVFADE
eukprot:Gregarina_sp_Poly_1__11522@NODE_99_length_14464_cov_198_334653_g86_i0_p1_GENE_NODE_99_length_14464_cov_198_334653_g86_i0NODE_99_length_14464_cov_198_334653_g86_i0_p1_ORF_typecomplete_len1341_score208_48eIF2A/PF08662_11/0_00011eIF2A/PF08662_11/1_5e36GYF/PF02213_16/6_9e15ANAPC4_WD40/PF12894_7/0_039ANAPC4_WD40/PF12894_7/1_6e03ANAPC4_WD40/PF12894_7/1e04ANAPC4_WD40/PF12894_7/0_69ANAPC4_WD40/PF12894_7/0_88WD40/PF00400_32/8_7e03WD40/PF00400_32/2_3e02WD40/PF00400_32/8e03WD40/PF00400_32/1_5e04WD40/PF0040